MNDMEVTATKSFNDINNTFKKVESVFKRIGSGKHKFQGKISDNG